MQPRDPQPYYFPIHYVEPLSGANLAALDVDIMTSPIRKNTVEAAINGRKPSLTGRLQLLAEQDTLDPGYSVILMHPGIHLANTSPDVAPLAVALIVVRIKALLARAVLSQRGGLGIYLFDATDSLKESATESPLFLGGALSIPGGTTFAAETDLSALRARSSKMEMDVVLIGDRKWIVAVVPTDSDYAPQRLHVIMGSALMLFACLCLATWFYSHMRRVAKMNKIMAAVETEKAALENAERDVIVERDLNDFIAHEVRNPLSAAISACSFVATEVNTPFPLAGEESRQTVREDIAIISSSLQFINDLLRNMLDMHRATSNQMHIEMAPADLLRDVLEPVATMLHRRGDAFEIILECEKNLIVQTDRMRLKQIILNLANNSRKFVQKGFIRLSACDIDGTVKLHVDDSGPGIPMEKRKNLFVKFQESLDSLNQGTGIGLSLSKNLAVLMNGDIWLDEDFDSGVEGCRGTRFVIDLNTAPLNFDSKALDAYELSNAPEDGFAATVQGGGGVDDTVTVRRELPDKLSVLFVDDDCVLRKLFTRSLQRIAPDWNLTEASNGETALRLAGSQEFDLIFMDQYMASVEKQMLGSEATRALRAKGVTSIICGLSANDCRDTFVKAGADDFLIKPFPCKKDALTRELLRILDCQRNPTTLFAPAKV
jgi:signal transduction histidine kinase/CheY-like chemotaxis protein